MADEKLTAQMVGRLGELAVERELLRRGWTVGNFNASVANTAVYDLFAVKGKRKICIRVKATSGSMVQYNAKQDGSIFSKLVRGDDGDFVVFVLLQNGMEKEFYILPTRIVENAIRKANVLWLGRRKRDGKPRKQTQHRALDFSGTRTATGPHRGMGKIWRRFTGERGWDLLETLA